MNKAHLKFCSSEEWAEAIRTWIIPQALDGVTLGDEVLEIGPGPGRTTEILTDMATRLTVVEIDGPLAHTLAHRLGAVRVVRGDGTALPFPDSRFSAVLSFTMLHHVPSVELQNRLLAEAARVLRPGGVLAGVDSHDGEAFRALHVDDICVPLDPGTVAERLRVAGFTEARVDPNPYVVQFWATA